MDWNYYESDTGKVYHFNHAPSGNGWTRLTHTEGKRKRQDYARAELRKLLKPGNTVHCMLRHVARSGMQREISLFVITGNDLRNIDNLAADATGNRVGKHDGIVMGGCGMDMGFALVYELGASLWPTGTPEPHGTRNGGPDRSGGYTLKHRWL